MIDDMNRCSVDGCNRQSKSLGYCGAHYQRHKKGKPLDDPPLREECSIRRCRRLHHSDTFCERHFALFQAVVAALGEDAAPVPAG